MLNLATARQWYPDGDAVHGFDHIERVYAMCQRIGREEGADMDILLAAALLHDSQGSHPGQGQRNNHHLRSAEFAAEVLAAEGWEEERIRAVQHCIRAHRYRRGEEAPATLEAKILFDADKLDVIGAVGVVRALAYAFQVQQPAFAEPSASYVKDGTKTPGEGHSAYHEYLFKLNKIAAALFTPTARRIAAGRQQFLNDYFEELAAEMRGKQ
jgi:Predicted HD superfamily hydrolase